MRLLQKLNLMLFDGEGAAGPSGGAQGEPGGNENAVAAQEEGTSQKASFEELIKGEYKKDFDAKVHGIINQRFRDHKTLKENADKAAPLMDFLSKRFGKESGDYDGLLNAMLDEDALFESLSMQRGESTEVTKQRMRDEVQQNKMRIENESLRSQLEARQQMERDMEAARLWREEAEAVKAVYDHFDISKEMKNPKFVDFMNRKIGMKAAFELAHFDELMSGAMHYTAQKVSEQVVNNIKSKAARPAENGSSARAPASGTVDVSRTTRAERDRIAQRVLRGEKVSFSK